MSIKKTYKIIDLFAGPGGLGEGFSSVEIGERYPFEIAVSAEMDAAAQRTLSLRSWFRKARRAGDEVRLARYYDYCNGKTIYCPIDDDADSLTREVRQEALRVELGTVEGNAKVDEAIARKRLRKDETILIGGPPCQAYSLVGRARNRGIDGYVPENDARHYLYLQYLRILAASQPAVFVMENVKGILSARVDGGAIFERILGDLRDPGKASGTGRGVRYQIMPVVADAGHGELDLGQADAYRTTSYDARSFIVRAEEHGIPQARHRVILLGIREDSGIEAGDFIGLVRCAKEVALSSVISDLPRMRSRLSAADSLRDWEEVVSGGISTIAASSAWKKRHPNLTKELLEQVSMLESVVADGGESFPEPYWGNPRNMLRSWYDDSRIRKPLNHEARSHMASDLVRYFFAATYAKIYGKSPKGQEGFDHPILHPEHSNWETGIFSDRFHVQCHDGPSTTVTSHISKDGHYFIHPDPLQCRSLTVREAARLQTFPDNYRFEGNRTQQYHQVGNAVPPYLARRIAETIVAVLP